LVNIDGKYRVKEELGAVYRLKNGKPLTTNYTEGYNYSLNSNVCKKSKFDGFVEL
jgi:hypothetical protein